MLSIEGRFAVSPRSSNTTDRSRGRRRRSEDTERSGAPERPLTGRESNENTLAEAGPKGSAWMPSERHEPAIGGRVMTEPFPDTEATGQTG